MGRIAWEEDDLGRDFGYAPGWIAALSAAPPAAPLVACDRCGAAVPEEETVGGEFGDLYCHACLEVETEAGERWTPEESFEEGGEL